MYIGLYFIYCNDVNMYLLLNHCFIILYLLQRVVSYGSCECLLLAVATVSAGPHAVACLEA